MRSRTTEAFWRLFDRLPADVQRQSRTPFRRWREDAHHPGLQFRRVHATEPIYSVRIGLHWRTLGLRDGEQVTWFWIGSHADYDRLIR
jgi:hypothetical protein